jgi:alpha-beta hydrolase superfamily lysophospholipase
MKSSRVFLLCGVVLVSTWILICAGIGYVAADLALHPGRRALTAALKVRVQAVAASNHAELADVSIAAMDGAILRGWNIRPQHGNGDTVILLHGHTDNRAGMLNVADMLLRHGYAVLLPDARAHGTSGGDIATYGVLEADDVRRWFDWAERAESPRCIGGLGESMGAAQILDSLSVTPGFCAVVAESSFASFREASYDRLAQKFGAGEWVGRTLLRPAVEAGFLYARWKYGVNWEQASPENAVAASSVPVLLIHGKKDTNLPPRHSEMILAHSSSRVPSVVLWEPEQAGHTGAAGAEPEEIERRVIGWFQSHVPAS